jgi:alkylation response protein AidB-like acyl-CoA dehydrogenase
MYFDLSKPQKLLADSVRDFCHREFPAERVRELMETEAAIDDRLWQEFADQGWLGLQTDEKYDGLGLGLVDLVVLAEEFGRACVPGPWLANTWGVTLLESIGGSAAADLLPTLVDGTAKIAVGAIEDDVSWNLYADTMEASIENGQLRGHKQLVQHAGQATSLLIPAVVSGKFGLVLVPSDADGVEIELTPGIDATRTLYRVTFSNVAVTDEQILATGDTAIEAWQTASRTMTVVVAAELLGVLEWMLAETVEYAKTRKQFDKPIGSFQAVQHQCAEILQLTESARAAVWYAAWTVQENTADAAQAVAVAKAYTSDAARIAGNLAVQCHGGIGFTWEHDLHLYYKRAKANEFLFGDASFHRDQLGSAALA